MGVAINDESKRRHLGGTAEMHAFRRPDDECWGTERLLFDFLARVWRELTHAVTTL